MYGPSVFSRMTTKSCGSVVTGCRALERPLVDVQVERDPHPDDQAAFEDARRDVGAAGGAEQDGVEARGAASIVASLSTSPSRR